MLYIDIVDQYGIVGTIKQTGDYITVCTMADAQDTPYKTDFKTVVGAFLASGFTLSDNGELMQPDGEDYIKASQAGLGKVLYNGAWHLAFGKIDKFMF